jgi:ribosomal-protein-alanine N-acetyltransferase
VTRPLRADDAEMLANLLLLNREFMAAYEPVRDDEYYTVEGQRKDLGRLLERAGRGDCVPLVILDDDGEPVGRITINNIVRGALQSGAVGYWVSHHANGRGLATRAVAEVREIGFHELGLHRLEACTLVDNVGSQRVLERNGFERYGMTPRYLNIAGAWRDHLMFHTLNE